MKTKTMTNEEVSQKCNGEIYQCPCCGQWDSGGNWNKETKVYFKGDIEHIEGEKDTSYYVCPFCKSESEGYKINEEFELE